MSSHWPGQPSKLRIAAYPGEGSSLPLLPHRTGIKTSQSEIKPMTSVNDVLSAIVEAQEAVRAVPELRNNIRNLEGEVALTRSDLDHERVKTDMLSAEVEKLRQERAELEAKLVEATFREKEAQGRASQVLGLLKTVQELASDAVHEVEPVVAKPEPTPEPAPAPETGPVPDTYHDWNRASDAPVPMSSIYSENASTQVSEATEPKPWTPPTPVWNPEPKEASSGFAPAPEKWWEKN